MNFTAMWLSLKSFLEKLFYFEEKLKLFNINNIPPGRYEVCNISFSADPAIKWTITLKTVKRNGEISKYVTFYSLKEPEIRCIGDKKSKRPQYNVLSVGMIFSVVLTEESQARGREFKLISPD